MAVVPLAYCLLERLPARAAILRYVGIVSGFAWPYICMYVLGWIDAAPLMTSLRGGYFVAEILVIPLMGFAALAGLSCASLFNRVGAITSVSDLAGILRSAPKKE
jgi:hypothetical protein